MTVSCGFQVLLSASLWALSCKSFKVYLWSQGKGKGESEEENTSSVILISGCEHFLSNICIDSWGFRHTKNCMSNEAWWPIRHSCKGLEEGGFMFCPAQLIPFPSLKSSWISRLKKTHILCKVRCPIGLVYFPKEKTGNLNNVACHISALISSVISDSKRMATECRLWRPEVHVCLIVEAYGPLTRWKQ